jgi:ABC-type glycerol-3-phosphate transport system permease component
MDGDDVAADDEEIYRSHYGLPIPAHWLKYATAWNEFGYATYFKNSTIVAVASGPDRERHRSMAGFAFARRRYHFPLREPLFLLIFLSIMFRRRSCCSRSSRSWCSTGCSTRSPA